MRTKAPAALPLFRSPVQVDLLTLLVADAERAWSAADLRRRLEAPAASVHRELHRALDAGLVERTPLGRTYQYRIATDSPAYQPLRDLLEVTVGVEPTLRAALESFPAVEAAAIHGSWAAGKVTPGSDVDLLVVGDVDYAALRGEIRSLESRLGRRIDLTAYRPDEFRELAAARNGFVVGVLQGPRRDLVGDLATLVG